MAEYKAVDAGQLDADLTLVAEAIRKRAGTSEALAFPEGMAETVRNIPAEGLVLPQLTDPGTASDLAYDKQLIDAYGNVVTGTLGEAAEGMMIEANTESVELSVGQLLVAQGVLRPDMVGNKDFGIIARAGARLVVQTPAENLGDAAASDVAKGKTFTSANGLKVEGTHECETGVTLPALTNPGTADDLASGRELIDSDGNVVTGTLNEIGEGAILGATRNKRMTTMSDSSIAVRAETTGSGIVRPGATLAINMPAAEFGDAAASDVAKGKTFTSAAGLQVEGTLEASSGGEETFFSTSGFLYKRNMVFPDSVSAKTCNLAWGNQEYLESVDFGPFTGLQELTMRGEFKAIKRIHAPLITVFQRCFWFTNNPDMESVILGSVGHPVTTIANNCFQYGIGSAEITVYVDAVTLAEIVSTVAGNAPWGAKNATIIYRNSTTGEVISE